MSQNTVNTYDICSPIPLVPHLIPHTRVTFAMNTNLSLPDRRYLKLHAAVCRIAHLSGAAEYVESYSRDTESTMVLAHDGTSADILSFALQRVQVFWGEGISWYTVSHYCISCCLPLTWLEWQRNRLHLRHSQHHIRCHCYPGMLVRRHLIVWLCHSSIRSCLYT